MKPHDITRLRNAVHRIEKFWKKTSANQRQSKRYEELRLAMSMISAPNGRRFYVDTGWAVPPVYMVETDGKVYKLGAGDPKRVRSLPETAQLAFRDELGANARYWDE